MENRTILVVDDEPQIRRVLRTTLCNAGYTLIEANIFDLPGTPEKFCWECSADFATVAQLSTEIGAAARAGRSTDTLESELSEMRRRILERTQSAGLSDV